MHKSALLAALGKTVVLFLCDGTVRSGLEPRHHTRIKRSGLPVLRKSDEVLQIRVHRDVLYRHPVGKPVPILDEL